jgi:hypothetical protein
VAARSKDADVVTAIMSLLESHGNEPLPTVAEGMATADIAFTCTTHAITHTRTPDSVPQTRELASVSSEALRRI